ncbi:response regulator [Flammeovirga yaeyamensis]|uniref:histidine kinase n=1 Tax=Flammeovirga yaeyamensis TaxID=367791 RepID=A0AAX1ND44_9BACT|nr:two-component regulator propeller domain-containing protein [Flammeovirga yaeyamensis]MBB3696632.1 signal transduction histidine kinase/ligand-binding sensor domain-containing protein/DNA-binding response OmpR family regulator [Flammeovirga yaeyamensis]NMF33305.1 response regulator [Flammeovirga yaeyamensis]QWG05416.1 response regulator [Flammeovirga yaeyamensis]
MCITFHSKNVYGQHQFNYFRHISTSEGFSLNSVNAIDQDEMGFIWFGTRNGLMRYDGVDLKVMLREEEDLKWQGVNDIFDIDIDSKGDILIGSRRGFKKYSPSAEAIEPLKLNKPDSYFTRRIFDVLNIDENQSLLGTEAGVDVYLAKENKLVSNKHKENNKETLSSNKITTIYRAPDSTIWVGTHNGLNKLISNKNGVLSFKRYMAYRSSNILVNAVLKDRKGNIWAGTSKGLFVLRKEAKVFKRFDKITSQSLTSNIIRCLTLDHQDRLWVGTYDGLNIIDKEFNLIAKVNHDPQNSNGLTGNNIRSLFTDVNGGIWIATYFGGVNYWSDKLMSFEKFDERNGTQLGYNVVNSIVNGDNNTIYFGTEGGGITIYDSKNRTFSKIDELSYRHPIGGVKTLLSEGNGKVWLGTFDRGLVHLNLKTKQHKEYRYDIDNPTSISSDKLISLQKAEDGNLWVGTINGGLNLLDIKKNTFTQFKANDSIPKIAHNNVRSLMLSSKGDLYVGTGLGISMLTKKSYLNRKMDFQFIAMEEGVNKNPYINDIIETNDGNIWVGTLSSGLYSIIGNKLTPVHLKNITSVYSIVEGKNDHRLWMSTEKGIVSYDFKSGEQKIFNSDNGVSPNEFNRGSRFIDTDGKIYFGGASGVTSFHPSLLGKQNEYAPDVVLSGISLFGNDIKTGDEYGILDQSIEFTDEITLDYDQHIFTISFSMPNYTFPDNKAYSYRMLGLDDAWIKTTNNNVSYAIQKGGDYIFEVKGYNSHGVESDNVTRLKVHLKSAPWLTTWAYILYSIVLIGIVGLITYFFRSRIYLEHKLEMESQELVHQQEIHQQKLRFFTNISHEFRTPLTLISGPLEKLISEYKGPSNVYKQLLVIKQNTDQLFKLINELMDFRKLENNQVQLKAAKGNIVKFIQEIYLSFSQQANLRSIEYTFDAKEEEIDLYYDRDQLEKVMYNLISNAFKYTQPKGSISIHVGVEDEMLTIGIKDSGIGIPSKHLDKIFDRFYMASHDGSRLKKKNGSGIGLAIVKDVIDLHKGEVRVESEKGKGSHFIIQLHLGREHLADDEIIEDFKDSEDISQYHESEDYLEEVKNASIDLIDEEVESEENNATVLVVEDNPDISKFIHNILSTYYKVHIAENGAVGFQQALSLQPDLIISDVMMPVMDGIEMCSKIKSDDRTSHIPVMLLTARTSLIYKINALESGAEDYLSKPFEVKELILKCKNMINTQQSLRKKYADNGATVEVEEKVNSVDEVLMNNAFKIIKDNVDNQFLNINFLCEELGISRSLLFTKFKAWTNQTPNEYILNIRMKKAGTLIEQGKVNISEVGYKVGFKSANYFSKSFKKHFNMSPKEYQAKFKESLGIED